MSHAIQSIILTAKLDCLSEAKSDLIVVTDVPSKSDIVALVPSSNVIFKSRFLLITELSVASVTVEFISTISILEFVC